EVLLYGLREVDTVSLCEPTDQRPLEPVRLGPRRSVDDTADQRLRQHVLRENERVRHAQFAKSGGRRREPSRIFTKSDAILSGTRGALDSAIHSARGPIT